MDRLEEVDLLEHGMDRTEGVVLLEHGTIQSKGVVLLLGHVEIPQEVEHVQCVQPFHSGCYEVDHNENVGGVLPVVARHIGPPEVEGSVVGADYPQPEVQPAVLELDETMKIAYVPVEN